MSITRRSVCTGAAVSAAFTTSSARPVLAVPASTSLSAAAERPILAQLAPAAPPPSQDDLRDQKTFENFLMQRIRRRAESADIKIDNDAAPEIDKFAGQAAAAAFEKQRPGQIDKQRDYRVLPDQIRRTIIMRNYDDLIDLLIFASREGGKITRTVVSNVRDFICPLYPFCQ
jgi:hypothetical protein